MSDLPPMAAVTLQRRERSKRAKRRHSWVVSPVASRGVVFLAMGEDKQADWPLRAALIVMGLAIAAFAAVALQFLLR